MKGFLLNNGDLVITNNELEMVTGNDLTVQTIQSVLATNKGEWIFDTNEGVNFDNILGKQKVVARSVVDSYYQKEYIAQQQDTSALAEMLRKRLDGE